MFFFFFFKDLTVFSIRERLSTNVKQLEHICSFYVAYIWCGF